MSHDEYPDDSTLAQDLRDSLSGLIVPMSPPLAAITNRGRVHKRRRRAGLGGVTGAAAVIALILGLTGVFGAVPGPGTRTTQTAAFTLSSYVDGTVSLTLSQLFDPAALQRALAQYRIPALVKVGSYCSSRPAAPNPFRLGVFPSPASDWLPSGAWPTAILQTVNLPVKPSQLAAMVDPVSARISPAAIPTGTELFIGDFDLGHTIYLGLIYTRSHTCRIGQEPPGDPGVTGPGPG